MLVVSACTTNDKHNKTGASTNFSTYKDYVKYTCINRYKKEMYCECYADIIDRNTPSETKKIMIGTKHNKAAEQNFYEIYLNSMKKIDTDCALYNTEDIAIPDFDVTSLMKKVIAKNKNEILDPSRTKNLKPLDKPIGWKFGLYGESTKDFQFGGFHVFKKAENGEYYFEYTEIGKNLPYVSGSNKWVNGYRYYKRKDKLGNPYEMSSEEICKFALGKCRFTRYDGKEEYIYTEFRDGLWIRNVPATRHSRALKVDIYDASGFSLYEYHKSLETGNFHENIRLESLQ